MQEVLAGKSGDVVYSIDLGERLTTGFPISISSDGDDDGGNATGIPQYVIFIVTPTSQIYSQFENILFTQRISHYLQLVQLEQSSSLSFSSDGVII